MENNFKKLEAEMEAKFENSDQSIKKNVKGQKHFWTIIGDMFELYIPKIMMTLVGGKSVSHSNSISDKNEI